VIGRCHEHRQDSDLKHITAVMKFCDVKLLSCCSAEVCMIVTCVDEGVVKPRDDDDDDDVFASTEDSAVPAVASIDSKRRSQSLSALTNDNTSSQTSDVIVRDTECLLPLSS